MAAPVWLEGQHEHGRGNHARSWLGGPARRRNATRGNKNHCKALDLVKRDFSLRAEPDTVWVGDLKQIPCLAGRFYLATVLDLHSRRVVGFATGARYDAPLAKAALCMAIAVGGGTVTGVIMHTDQGGEYTDAYHDSSLS